MAVGEGVEGSGVVEASRDEVAAPVGLARGGAVGRVDPARAQSGQYKSEEGL